MVPVAPPTPPAVIQAVPVEGTVRVDGRLDEPAWEKAPELALAAPEAAEGAAAFVTTVKVLAAPEGLYVAFRCVEPEPDQVRVHSWQRDGGLGADDGVALRLSPPALHRGRRPPSYLFRVNAVGAREDGTLGPAGAEDLRWDGPWRAAVARTQGAWTVEVFISGRGLRFRQGRGRWGLRLERHVARQGLHLAWAGDLEGAEPVRRGHGLALSPFLVLPRSKDFRTGETHFGGRMGLDLAAELGPAVAEAGIRPDFTEAEADERRLNLTRFPLFYPEKRAFFLDAAGPLRFGPGADPGPGWDPDGAFIPFHTRTLGLDAAGGQVPVRGDLKVNGQAGETTFIALGVRQRALSAERDVDLGGVRAAWEPTPHLQTAFLGTGGDPTGLGRGTLGLVDLRWRQGGPGDFGGWLLEGWAGRADTRRPSDPDAGAGSAFGLEADYGRDPWRVRAALRRFGEGFRPTLAFLPRPGTRQAELGASGRIQVRSAALAWIRELRFETSGAGVDGLDGRPQSRRLTAGPLRAVAPTGDWLQFSVSPQREVLDRPFAITPTVTLPPGDYRFFRRRAELASSAARRWRLGTSVEWGSFYGGRLVQWDRTGGIDTKSGKWRLGVTSQVTFAHLPTGAFTQKLAVMRGEYLWKPELILTGLLQYDTDTRDLAGQFRWRWSPRPGLEVYLVGNRAWHNPNAEGAMKFLPQRETVTAKVRWTFRP